MASISRHFFDLGHLDDLAGASTPLHRLDPRAKLLATLVFIAVVVSFGKYEIAALIPFFVYPVFLISVGNIPFKCVLSRLVLALPFALLVGIFNPLIDRAPLSHLANFTISGGWISFSSIMLRFVLTVSSVLALIAVTGFSPVCSALLRLGTPKIFVVQLMLMHRYLFVLLDEASKMVGAKSLRTFENSTGGLRIYGAFTGSLLLRTMERAERIYSAMQCRGFDGDIKRTLPAEFGKRDILFLCGWSLLFLLLRAFNLPLIIGQILTGTM